MSWSEYTLDTLIDNWGKNIKISKNTNSGKHDNLGIYKEPSEEWEDDFGIICVMTNNVLNVSEPGVYTTQDKYYITRTNCQIGIWVNDGNLKYKIHERADFSFFDQTDLYIYKIKLDNGRLDNSDE